MSDVRNLVSKIEIQIIINLIELILLALVTFLVHSITLVDAYMLTLLFMSVLVIARGVMYYTQSSTAIQNFECTVAATPSSIGSMVVQASKFYAVARSIQPGIYYFCRW